MSPHCDTVRETEPDLSGVDASGGRVDHHQIIRQHALVTLADDSGLEVDALSGAPGVYSARYAGEEASDADRRAKLIDVLHRVPAPRRARFRCVIAIAQPGGAIDCFEGVCEGEIILEERGANGFGYDPVFYLPEHGCTMAELPSAVKNQMSHRARAAQAARLFLHKLTTNHS